MHRFLCFAGLLGVVLQGWCAPVRAQFDSLETERLRLVYQGLRHGYVAGHAARCFENAMEFYHDVFHYVPSQKVTILLDDSSDYCNAGATSSPRNFLSVQVSPSNTVYETTPGNESLNHTMNHELGHIVALDQSAGSDDFFRAILFGKVRETADHPETILYSWLTTPRRSAPRWFHEGVAVFLETWMAGGLGRAQGAYDEMVFRAMVKDGTRFYDPLGLESEGTKVDFQVGVNSYLYGTRFVSWLGLTYSPDHLVRWVSRTPGSSKSYEKQFEKVFGRTLNDAWNEWIAFEHGFQQANLEALREYPITAYRDISPRALGSVSRAHFDEESRTLYVAVNFPGVVGHIAAISTDDGSMRQITDVKGPALYFVTSLAYDPDSKVLFYSADNYEWRDLYQVDPVTGEVHRLIKDARIGDLVYNRHDRSLWGVRHFNGIASLVRIPYPYTKFNRIHSFPYGQVIYDIDLSPDGTQISFSLAEITGRQTLRIADLPAEMLEEMPSRELYDFGQSLPGNFVFSPDGEYLYGSSYYTGVSNVWRYSVVGDSMNVVTNCETGMFRPVPRNDGSLVVFRYTGEGFVPATIDPQPVYDVNAITFLGAEVAEKHPEVMEWNVGSPLDVDIESMTTYQGEYHAVSHLGVTHVVPIVEGYKDYAGPGFAFSASDPAYMNLIDGSVSYTPGGTLPDRERLHASLQAKRREWTLRGKWNGADFYDLFGPTKTSRKGYMVGLEYARSLVHDRPKTVDLDVTTAYYGDLERLPYAQNIYASYDRLWFTSVDLSFANRRRSIGSVDYEKGYQGSFGLVQNYVNGRAFVGALSTFDAGMPFVLPNSSLWLRTAAGWAPGERDEPFSNFFFGGFGNNYVDHGSYTRYREYYSFPGIELNDAAGTNFAKALVEWNLPPVRFRHIGVPAFYVTWLRPALFASALVTNTDDDMLRETLGNVGGQLDLRFSLMSRLNMTLSVGYAIAASKQRVRSDEFMLSLKIL